MASAENHKFILAGRYKWILLDTARALEGHRMGT
jgi:hypothetical protein